jgi:hypothetical protein
MKLNSNKTKDTTKILKCKNVITQYNKTKTI